MYFLYENVQHFVILMSRSAAVKMKANGILLYFTLIWLGDGSFGDAKRYNLKRNILRFLRSRRKFGCHGLYQHSGQIRLEDIRHRSRGVD